MSRSTSHRNFPLTSAIFWGTVAVSALSACSKDGPSAPVVRVATLALSRDTLSLVIGAQSTVAATARSAAGVLLPRAAVTWASSDTGVASVVNGIITARRFGQAEITARASTVSALARLQVLAPNSDSASISSTDTTRIVTGLGTIVTAAPSAALAGLRVVVEETAPPAGSLDALGPAITVSLARSAAHIHGDGHETSSALSFTLSGVTRVPASPSQGQESSVAYQITIDGGSPFGGEQTPIWRLSDTETPFTSGTGVPMLRSSTALSLPEGVRLRLLPVAAPSPCSQLEFPDGERLYRVRTPAPSMAPAPFALVLVHGWQPQHTRPPHSMCENAESWKPEAHTWSTMLDRFYPADGSAGEDPRLQLFDVWIAHYPTHGSIASNGDALARLLASRIPSKRIVVLAHSMGGLVTAAAMKHDPSLPIDTIVALGTPWRGSPIPGGLWLYWSGSFCDGYRGALEGTAVAAFTWLTQGSRDLSDANNGYLQTTLRPTIDALAPRIAAVGGDIRSSHVGPVDTNFRFYAYANCALSDVRSDGSDGVVPINSVTAENTIVDRTIVSGLDHSRLLTMAGSSDPLGIAASRFSAYARNHAPIASIRVLPQSVQLVRQEEATLAVELLDATGSELAGRAVQWTSSDPTTVSVDGSSGRIRGIRGGGPVTVTATAVGTGKSASSQVSVLRTIVDGPPTNLTVTIHGSNALSLSWTDNSADEEYFLVEQAADPAGPFSEIAHAPTNATGYELSASPATNYYYRVAAARGLDRSSFVSAPVARTLAELPWLANVSATAQGGRLFALSPRGYYWASTSVMAYDPSLDVWTEGAYANSPYGTASGAVTIGGDLYVTGGVHGWAGAYAVRTLAIYSPLSNSWSYGADYPDVTYGGVAGAINGRLYVYTSIPYVLNSDGAAKSVHMFAAYDPALNTWTPLPLPPERISNRFGGAVGGRFYLMGGTDTDGNRLRRVDVFDPETQSWTSGPPLLIARLFAATAVSGNKMYLVGGYRSGASYCGASTDLDVFDATTQSFTAMSPLRAARHSAGAAVIGNLLYVVGGTMGCSGLANDFTRSVEIVRLPP